MLILVLLLGICLTGSRSQFPIPLSATRAPPLPGQNTMAPPLPGQNTMAPPLPGHNTMAPPLPGHNTAAPPLPGGIDPTCIDKLPNCGMFPKESCKEPYEAWAKDNCKNTCKFCRGPNRPCFDKLSDCAKYPETSCKAPFRAWAHENCNNTCKFCQGPTVPPPECKDNLTDCAAYPKETCSNPRYIHWAETQCRYYCRKCSAAELALKDAVTTTMSPLQCVDKLKCKMYGKSSCCGQYRSWAKTNCPVYCGICKGNPGPTLCVDKLPNCSSYSKDTCTKPDFKLWAEANCMKFCNLCNQHTDNGDPCANVTPFPQTTAHPPYPIPG